MDSLTLRPGDISLAELRRIARGNDSIALAEGWRKGVDLALASLGRPLASGDD